MKSKLLAVAIATAISATAGLTATSASAQDSVIVNNAIYICPNSCIVWRRDSGDTVACADHTNHEYRSALIASPPLSYVSSRPTSVTQIYFGP